MLISLERISYICIKNNEEKEIMVHMRLSLLLFFFLTHRDYEEHRELDVLDPEMLDDRQFEPMTAAQRYAAEQDIARRHKEEEARAREQQKRSDEDRMNWLQRIPASILMTDRELEERERRANRAEVEGEGRQGGSQGRGGRCES